LGEEVADLGGVADWDFLLVLAVGDGDTVRDVLVGELGKRKEEIEVGLIGVVGLGWAVSIGDQKSSAASAEFCDWGWESNTQNVLVVKVGLTRIIGADLVIETAVELDNSELILK